MSLFITASDVRKLILNNETELHVSGEYRLTDVAREMLQANNIRIVNGEKAQTSGGNNPEQRQELKGSSSDGTNIRSVVTGNAAPVSAVLSSDNNAVNRVDYDLVILGGQCVIPEMGILRANIGIKGDKIVALTKDLIRGKKTIDAQGMFVLPGIIDPHTHLGLFDNLDEELETETRSALLGGVTTVGTYFNQEASYLNFIPELERRVRALSRIDIIPSLAIRTKQQIRELPEYSARGMNTFKVYMCGVKGLYPHQDDGFIIKLMKAMKALPPTVNPMLSIHCENTSICDYAEEDMEGLTLQTLDDWNQTHPNIAEGEAVIRAAYFAKKMDVRTYVVHSSTKEAMAAIRKLKHPKLLVETTSPYLSLDTSSDIGVYGKMAPPIREQESRKALWDALKDGLIDTIGTDNTVMTSEEKNIAGGMQNAGPGYPTLGTHLVSLLNEGVFKQEVPLEKLIPLITMNPAKIFGVYPQKGTLMPGSDADIVLVDLNNSGIADPAKLLSRSDFSIFQGKNMRGWPFATIKGGKIAVWDGELVDDTLRGTVLKH